MAAFLLALIWICTIGLGVVLVLVAVLVDDAHRDEHAAIEQHRRAMRALEPRGR